VSAAPDDAPDRAVYWAALAHATIAALPLLLARGFHYDWAVHAWLASHIASGIAGELRIPVFLELEQHLGNPTPLFYGAALYTTLSPLIAAFGPEIGMRIAGAFALAAPTFVFAAIVARAGLPRGTAVAVVLILATSIVQLSNLYNRGGVTEFFAHQLLLLGGLALLRATIEPSRGVANLWVVLGTLALAAGLGSHPPTAYLALVFLPVPTLLFVVWQRRAIAAGLRRAWPVLPLCALVLVPTALWVWLVYANRAALTLFTAPLSYLPWWIDHWLARFLPWPVNLREEIVGFARGPSQFLSAPVNVLAMLLLGALAWRSWRAPADRGTAWPRRAFIVAAAAAIVVAVAVSLPIWPLRILPDPSVATATPILVAGPETWIGWLFGRVQATYRLVGTANQVTVLAACALLAAAARRQPDVARPPLSPRLAMIVLVGAVVAMVGLAQKAIDVAKEYALYPQLARRADRYGVTIPGGRELRLVADDVQARDRAEARIVTHLPAAVPYYVIGLYDMARLFRAYDAAPDRAAVDAAFERVQPWRYAAALRCAQPCAARTPIAASPFFTLRVDGARVDDAMLRQADGRVVVLLEPGDHRLDLEVGTRTTAVVGTILLGNAALFWILAAAIPIVAIRRSRRGARSRPDLVRAGAAS